MIGNRWSCRAELIERVAGEQAIRFIGGQDDCVSGSGDAENAISDADGGAMEVAADAFPPVLFAGGNVVTRNDAAIGPHE